jgi:hypothetical protein
VEEEAILPEEQCGFRPKRSTLDMIFVARLLQELGRQKTIQLFLCFVDLQKAYDTVDRKLLWKVLRKYGLPRKLILIIQGFHDGMLAKILVQGVMSEMFGVSGGLRQGCPLACLLFNIFFAAVLKTTLKEFHRNPLVVENFVVIKPKNKIGAIPNLQKQLGESSKFDQRVLWSMLFADDTGVASLSGEALSEMMDIFVSTCAAFGLTVSEKKTEAMVSVVSEEEPKVEIEITGGDQVYKQTEAFVYLGSKLTATSNIKAELGRRYQSANFKMRKLSKTLDCRVTWVAFKVILFKQQVLEVLLYGCPTWTMKTTDYAILTGYHRFFLHRLTGWRRDKRDKDGKRHISYRELLRITKCECIEALVRRRRLTYAGHVVRMEDGRLPKILLLGELVGGKTRRGSRKNWLTCLSDDLRSFDIEKSKWIKEASEEGIWGRKIDEGAKFFMKNWMDQEEEKHKKRVEIRRLEEVKKLSQNDTS